jgi:hypothetical protein
VYYALNLWCGGCICFLFIFVSVPVMTDEVHRETTLTINIHYRMMTSWVSKTFSHSGEKKAQLKPPVRKALAMFSGKRNPNDNHFSRKKH